MEDMESRVAAMESLASEGAQQDDARREAAIAMQEAEVALQLGDHNEAKTLAAKALIMLQKFDAPFAEVAVAKNLTQRIDAIIDRNKGMERALAALNAAENALAENRLEAAQAQASIARSETSQYGDYCDADVTKRLYDLESRVTQAMQAYDTKKRVHEALEAARTALELSQVPGRRDKVAQARHYIDTAHAALAECTATSEYTQSNSDLLNLGQLESDMCEVDNHVCAAEKWVVGCEEGDRLVSLARLSMEEGSWDEAAGHCRDAMNAYAGARMCVCVYVWRVECALLCATMRVSYRHSSYTHRHISYDIHMYLH